MRTTGMLFVAISLTGFILAGCQNSTAPENSTRDVLMSKTTVPGHSSPRYDQDGNGFPDAGVYVNGHYTSVYAYDANGDYYWDLGDGRVLGTVNSIDELDQATLTTCDYVVNYRLTSGTIPTWMPAGFKIISIVRAMMITDTIITLSFMKAIPGTKAIPTGQYGGAGNTTC